MLSTFTFPIDIPFPYTPQPKPQSLLIFIYSLPFNNHAATTHIQIQLPSPPFPPVHHLQAPTTTSPIAPTSITRHGLIPAQSRLPRLRLGLPQPHLRVRLLLVVSEVSRHPTSSRIRKDKHRAEETQATDAGGVPA
jgi:hypothetical protein